ncbi:PglL family O-oligosaccharyltransferase [Microbulbifer pacificus]|uniref:Wzy polymerase domain-containing protein n=1 Tax=Microbulbifer pacificus TaxID=407164 RepID=A0AAU0N1P5_9GAMM|nr:Wzy polymerase domain-containing protein [Microbulbifer pacificus]WOX06392.1 Wzy polymerase domain-containing protein [Microbulbifer pacificus]
MALVSRYSFALSFLIALCGWLISDHYYPWTSFYHDYLIACALLVFFLGVVFWEKGSLEAPAPVVVILLLAIVPLMQGLFGQVFFLSDAWLASLYLIGGAVALSIGFSIAKVRLLNVAVALSCLFILGGILSAGISLHQWLGLETLGIWALPGTQGGRVVANLSQPNNLSTFLSLSFVCSFYLWNRKLISVAGFTGVTVFLLMGIVLTQSRTAWVIYGLIAFWVLVRPICFTSRWRAVVFIIFIPVCYLLLFVLLREILALLLIGGEFRVMSLDSNARLDIWQQLFLALFEMPLWGYGWGQVGVAQTVVAGGETLHAPMTLHAHNLFLDLLLWNGWVIGTATIGLVIYWGASRAYKVQDAESFLGMAAVGCLFVHSMLEFPAEYAYLLLPVCVFAGLVEAQMSGWSVRVSRILTVPLIVVMAVFLGWIGTEYQRVEMGYRQIRFEGKKIALPVSQEVVSGSVLFDQLGAFLWFSRQKNPSTVSDRTVERMSAVAARYPYPGVIVNYAEALVYQGNYTEANRQLRVLQRTQSSDIYCQVVDFFAGKAENEPAFSELVVVKFESEICDKNMVRVESVGA